MRPLEHRSGGVVISAQGGSALTVTGIAADELAELIVASGRKARFLSVRGEAMPDVGETLAGQERAVMGFIGAGLTNQEISDRMYLSINTVKGYIRSAYRKVGLQTRSEAVRWAIRYGLAVADR